MRLCFICPEYPDVPHGGIGTFTQLFARELVKAGHEVRVIGVYATHLKFSEYENDQGVEVYRIRALAGKFGWIPAWIKQYRIIKKWISDNRTDLVEAPDSRGWFAFWPKLTIPLVLRFHGSQTFIAHLTNKKPNKLTRLLESLSYRRADVLISVSRFNAAVTSKLFKIQKNINVIYNGIDIRDTDVVRRRHNFIVFAGTVNDFKGITDFLDALLLLAKEGVEFSAGIYGKDAILKNGRKASEYISEISASALMKGKLNYHGSITREELMKIYQEATVAVFPSHVESFGLAPIEAMLCECPVIFTNNTTGPEITEDGTDAILVPPYNPPAIKNAVLRILSDPEMAEKMGKKARQHVIEKFNIQEKVVRNLAVYSEILPQWSGNKSI
jgi:glycosyltransferase involved in cell wall biosynthesis